VFSARYGWRCGSAESSLKDSLDTRPSRQQQRRELAGRPGSTNLNRLQACRASDRLSLCICASEHQSRDGRRCPGEGLRRLSAVAGVLLEAKHTESWEDGQHDSDLTFAAGCNGRRVRCSTDMTATPNHGSLHPYCPCRVFFAHGKERQTGSGNSDDIEVAEANRGRHAAPLPCL